MVRSYNFTFVSDAIDALDNIISSGRNNPNGNPYGERVLVNHDDGSGRHPTLWTHARLCWLDWSLFPVLCNDVSVNHFDLECIDKIKSVMVVISEESYEQLNSWRDDILNRPGFMPTSEMKLEDKLRTLLLKVISITKRVGFASYMYVRVLNELIVNIDWRCLRSVE